MYNRVAPSLDTFTRMYNIVTYNERVAMTQRTFAITQGQHRNKPRVYLQGKYLAAAGFTPSTPITIEYRDGEVVLTLDPDGTRRVSGKRAGTVSVIDINNQALGGALGDASNLTVRLRDGEIRITPARTEIKQRMRTRNGKEGSLFSGGGLLTTAAAQAGYQPAWACEIDPRYAETYSDNHPRAHMFQCSVAELDLNDLEPVELLTAGIPCQPFSRKRSRTAVPEAHALGDMVFWTLRVIDAMNPATVLIEQVERFQHSGAYHILRLSLERLGYDVEARVVDAVDFGAACGRKRLVVVATSAGEQMSWQPVNIDQRAAGAVLDDVTEDSPEWFGRSEKPWLFAHWEKQAAAGRFFKSQQIDSSTQRIQCISKRYFSGQGDGVVVKHPSRPDTFRWLRVGEVARLMELPEGYQLPAAKTVAGEILGQGVHVGTFRTLLQTLN